MIRDIIKCYKNRKVADPLHKETKDEFLQYLESHIMRANIARVIGLIEILKLTNKNEHSEIIAKLEKEVNDLQYLLDELKEVLPGILKDKF
jgi:hypothetical protein